MKRKIFVLLIFSLVMFPAFGQQTFKWSQYLMNRYSLNPAVGGLEGCLVFNGGYRMQWAGFDHAPRTMMVSGHRALGKDNSFKSGWHGIGARVFRDVYGPFEVISVDPSYAYHINVNRDWVFSAGIFVSFRQYTVNPGRLRENGGIINESDPVFSGTQLVWTYPIFTPGIWLNNTKKKSYFGLSIEQVWKSNMSSLGGNRIGTQGRLANHYNFMFGRRVEFKGYDMSLEPSALIQYRWAFPPSIDLNLMWHLRQKAAFGIAYRNTEGIVGLVELQLNRKWRMGYSFDFATSQIRRGTNLYTHEISLRFVQCFGDEKAPNICPAYD